MGQIVTFYSYKGGTGRTMAMANVGWILASAGHRVLMVDWDLEAPGLHRYLHPFLHDKELVASTGIIDIVLDFAIQATTPASGEADTESGWYLPLADVLRYAISIDWQFGKGQLDILPAGQQTPAYASRVNSFNWDNFYERLGGGAFLEALRQSMRREYDYVLIDSRTGVSDTSGICTVQMPDQVVVCFTLNRQSIEGAAAVARSIVAERTRAGRAATLLFPVPTRVENAEKERLDAARGAARGRFDEFLHHVPAARRSAYWAEVEIPYQAYYAYEEVLATFGGSPPEVGTLLHAVQQIAARLTGADTLSWSMPSPEKRAQVLVDYGWQPAPAAESPPAASALRDVVALPRARFRKRRMDPVTVDQLGLEVPAVAPLEPAVKEPGKDAPRHESWAYISYAHADADETLERFVADLEYELRQRTGDTAALFYEPVLADRRRDSINTLVDALGRSRVAVLLISPAYVQSRYVGQEVGVMRHLGMPMLPVPWVPMRGSLPQVLADLQAITSDQSVRAQSSGVRALSRLQRFDTEYREYVAEVARHVLQLGSTRTPAGPTVPDWESPPNAFALGESEPRGAGSHVCLGYVAPTEQDARQLGLPAARYGARPEDWHPFGPVSVRVLAEAAVALEHSTVDTIEVGSSLVETLRASDAAGRLSFLLVDPAALRVDRYRRVLSDVDALVLHTVRVIVVWPSDGGGDAGADREAIADVFHRLSETRTLPQVHGEAELDATVRRHLVVMRTEAIRTSVAPPRQAPPTLRINR